MRQITSVVTTVQNLLGEVADAGERVKNLLTWASPHITVLLVAALLALSLVMVFVSFR